MFKFNINFPLRAAFCAIVVGAFSNAALTSALASDLYNVPEIDSETGEIIALNTEAPASPSTATSAKTKPQPEMTALEQPKFAIDEPNSEPPHEPPHEPSLSATEAVALENVSVTDRAGHQQEASSSNGQNSSSGFYLRGSVGGSFEVQSEFSQTGMPALSRDLGNAIQLSGSAGYAFNDILRLEAEIGYLGNLKAKNVAGQNLDLNAVIFSANIFADLGTVKGFTPYVGVGLGAAKIKKSDTRLRFNAQAGVAYKINEQMSLEFGYEYSLIDGGKVDFNGTNFEQDDFDSHMIKIGTRFKF